MVPVSRPDVLRCAGRQRESENKQQNAANGEALHGNSSWNRSVTERGDDARRSRRRNGLRRASEAGWSNQKGGDQHVQADVAIAADRAEGDEAAVGGDWRRGDRVTMMSPSKAGTPAAPRSSSAEPAAASSTPEPVAAASRVARRSSCRPRHDKAESLCECTRGTAGRSIRRRAPPTRRSGTVAPKIQAAAMAVRLMFERSDRAIRGP